MDSITQDETSGNREKLRMRNLHPAIAEFIKSLIDCSLLCPGEGEVIARNINRRASDYGFMRDIIATRAAHKREVRGAA